MRDSMDLIGTFQKQDTIFVLNCRSKGNAKKGNPFGTGLILRIEDGEQCHGGYEGPS